MDFVYARNVKGGFLFYLRYSIAVCFLWCTRPYHYLLDLLSIPCSFVSTIPIYNSCYVFVIVLMVCYASSILLS